MSTRTSRPARWSLLGAVSTLAAGFALLVGCSSGVNTPPTDVEETAAEEAPDVPSTPGDAGGTETVPLPEDFPPEIPLPELPLIEAEAMGSTWVLLFATDDQHADFQAVRQLLKDEGFEHAQDPELADSDEATGGMMTREPYMVVFSENADANGDPVIQFQVQQQGG